MLDFLLWSNLVSTRKYLVCANKLPLHFLSVANKFTYTAHLLVLIHSLLYAGLPQISVGIDVVRVCHPLLSHVFCCNYWEKPVSFAFSLCLALMVQLAWHSVVGLLAFPCMPVSAVAHYQTFLFGLELEIILFSLPAVYDNCRLCDPS